MGKSILRKPLLILLTVIIVLTNTSIVQAVERVPIPSPDSVKYVAEMYTAKTTVDSKKVFIQTCAIGLDTSIYVKVRDVANALKKTDKKFNFSYNSKKNTLSIAPGKSYKAIGGENQKSDLTFYDAINKSTKVYVNKKVQEGTVYHIEGEPYLTIDSLGKMINFSVTISKTTYKIDTKKGYTAPKDGTGTSIPTATPVISLEDGDILKNPYPNAQLTTNPQTVEDVENIIAYMYLYNVMEYSFEVPYEYTEKGAEELLNLRERAADNRIDLTSAIAFSGWLGITESYYPESSSEFLTKVTYKLGYSEVITDSEVMKRNKEYLTKVQATVKGLIDNGKLTAKMTQTQKAQVLFNWVTENVVYDTESFNQIKNNTEFNPDCQTGRAALIKGTAVCNGYASLYNLMCRFVGIYETYGVFGTANGGGHAWIYQILDGKACMSDPTWGSGYFAKSADYFAKDHVWDTKVYSEWSNAPGIY